MGEELRKHVPQLRVAIGDADYDAMAEMHGFLAQTCVICMADTSHLLLNCVKELRPQVVLVDDGLVGAYTVGDLIRLITREYGADCIVLCEDDFDDAMRKRWVGEGAVTAFPHPTKTRTRLVQLKELVHRRCMASPLFGTGPFEAIEKRP